MTITKTEILAHVNNELYRSEDDIDSYILRAMKDLSLQDDFVWIETTVPTIVGRPYYSLPTDYKKLMTIKIDDNTPLEKINWRVYQRYIADQTSDNYDLPTCFTIHGGFWYPYPISDAIYTATLFYNAFVPESESIDSENVNAVDNIGRYFSDIYREALYCKTKALYCRSKGLKSDALDYQMEYMNVILPPLKKMVQREPHFVKCQDV